MRKQNKTKFTEFACENELKLNENFTVALKSV